jgi:hypothetical protein
MSYTVLKQKNLLISSEKYKEKLHLSCSVKNCAAALSGPRVQEDRQIQK